MLFGYKTNHLEWSPNREYSPYDKKSYCNLVDGRVENQLWTRRNSHAEQDYDGSPFL